MAKVRGKGKPDWSSGENRKKERVEAILRELERAYPEAELILRYETPFQLLCATILAARASDEKINEITPRLFQRFPKAADLAEADFEEVAELVKSSGFFRQKAGRLIAVSRELVDQFEGRVPRSVQELTRLPGIGKKTAIMVINHGFEIPVGIAVDTHVHRAARRLDWSHNNDPDKVEAELRELIPASHWIPLQDLLAFHGRAHCKAPKPHCTNCPVENFCYCPEKIYSD